MDRLRPRFAALAFAALLLLALLTGCAQRTPTAPGQQAPALSNTAAGVTFRVSVPSNTPAGDTVFVAGDFQGWDPRNPAYALAKQLDGRWTITLPLTPGAPIQFKFTRGGWARVEKGSSGQEIANRTLTPQADQTYDFTVARWADLGTITGHVETFQYAPFLSGRKIWVYLPPGYSATTRRYSVLYMHDGQNLFDASTSFAGVEWQVDEACESLITSGEIEPIIVVGIENGGGSRINEYTPWPDPSYGGGGGNAYLTAIRDVLKPEIDRRYRTMVGESHTFMAGSSLGGLISAYAGYHYAGTFKRVACVSPSYWWDSRHMISDAQANGRPAVVRWYQDIGTAEGASAVQDTRDMRDVLIGQGFQLGVDLSSVEASGHAHNETSWAQRTPGMLRFLIGHPATTGVDGP